MAAKSILKATKSPLHLLRLSAALPKPAAAADELSRALRSVAAAVPPAPIAEAAILRHSPCDLGGGRLWSLNSELLRVQARGRVVDEDSDDEDFDDFDDDDEDFDDVIEDDGETFDDVSEDDGDLDKRVKEEAR